MIKMMDRNLKLFFRDKGAVLFSLLAVFIIIGLYLVFLGNIWGEYVGYLDDVDALMNTWLVAGILAVGSLTTTLGAFGVMVEDRARKICKDFYASPIGRGRITAGYLGSAFVVGVIMSMITLLLAQVFLAAKGIGMLSLAACLNVFCLILVSALSNTALVCFITSFVKSHSAFSSLSTVLGTLVGFLTGIYLPVGSLPGAVQNVVKIFPASHGAALLRQVIMEESISSTFDGVPAEYVTEFKEYMGVTYQIGDLQVTTAVSIGILLLTAVVFFGLAYLNMSRKQK